MASKKPAVSRSAKPASKPAGTPAAQTATPKKAWTLPIVMLMLVVGAAALLMAVRESSNAPEAAMASMTSVAPDTHASGASSGDHSPAAANAKTAAARTSGSESTPAKPADEAAAIAPKPVSITGCLQQTERGFVLKNTEGADAPKSRSWKSGFLKRSSASIELSDASGSAAFGKHVGRRVRVTGALVERDMKVLSLRPISASCE